MAHEAFIISALCGALAFESFKEDWPLFGCIYAVLCVAWAIIGVDRSLS